MLRSSEFRNGADVQSSSRFAVVQIPYGLLRLTTIVQYGLGTRFTM